MSNDQAARLAQRIRELAIFLASSDAVRVRVERGDEELEVARNGGAAPAHAVPAVAEAVVAEQPLRLEAIKADLVGIFHLGRPVPMEGELLDGDRELGYVEALGMRNPVRSLGVGRIVSIAAGDGDPVEYGQPLFLLDRG